jgi:hypothetical protein
MGQRQLVVLAARAGAGPGHLHPRRSHGQHRPVHRGSRSSTAHQPDSGPQPHLDCHRAPAFHREARCDRIIVLDNGRIIEAGQPRRQLMDAGRPLRRAVRHLFPPPVAGLYRASRRTPAGRPWPVRRHCPSPHRSAPTRSGRSPTEPATARAGLRPSPSQPTPPLGPVSDRARPAARPTPLRPVSDRARPAARPTPLRPVSDRARPSPPHRSGRSPTEPVPPPAPPRSGRSPTEPVPAAGEIDHDR